MVIKKKITYEKQKGGLLRIPIKLNDYFNFIKNLINAYYLDATTIQNISELEELITGLSNKVNTYVDSSRRSNNIYLLNLTMKIMDILKRNQNINTVKKYQILISEILYCLLSDIFLTTSDDFIKYLIKIFINILFIQYLNDDINQKNNLSFKQQIQSSFKKKIQSLFMTYFINKSLLNDRYLIYLLRIIILENFKGVYGGIPVFYGNGYNKFICEKVGIISTEKRNYIINPVGALTWMYINKKNYFNTPLYNLLAKILRFEYSDGNKRRDVFSQLPKLELLKDSSSTFCIALDENGDEIIIQPSTIKKCSLLYGCKLVMTPKIREENIASNEHILELLSILLEEELNKPINLEEINNRERERKNRERERKNREMERKNKIKKMQTHLNNEQLPIYTNINPTINKLKTEIDRWQKEIGRYNVQYTPKEIKGFNEKIKAMQRYLIEIMIPNSLNNPILP